MEGGERETDRQGDREAGESESGREKERERKYLREMTNVCFHPVLQLNVNRLNVCSSCSEIYPFIISRSLKELRTNDQTSFKATLD